jgi:hypothetical protein
MQRTIIILEIHLISSKHIRKILNTNRPNQTIPFPKVPAIALFDPGNKVRIDQQQILFLLHFNIVKYHSIDRGSFPFITQPNFTLFQYINCMNGINYFLLWKYIAINKSLCQ